MRTSPAFLLLPVLLALSAPSVRGGDASAVSGRAPRFTVTELVGVGHERSSVGRFLSDRGEVVGISSDGQVQHAVVWSDGKRRTLEPAGDTSSHPLGLNDQGQVVGSADVGAPTRHAVLWQDGKRTDLDPAAGAWSQAVAINRRGQVAGTADMGKGPHHAVVWAGGVMRDLGTLGGKFSVASGINDRGQVIGWSSTAGESAQHAFFRADDKMVDLGTLPGFKHSSAVAVNNQGEVAGYAFGDTGASRGFMWRAGKLQDLGTLGGVDSFAAGINDRGQIVGRSHRPDGATRAFLWEEGKMQDLNELIPERADGGLVDAVSINARGQILALNAYNGATHLFLLTPRDVTSYEAAGLGRLPYRFRTNPPVASATQTCAPSKLSV